METQIKHLEVKNKILRNQIVELICIYNTNSKLKPKHIKAKNKHQLT